MTDDQAREALSEIFDITDSILIENITPKEKFTLVHCIAKKDMFDLVKKCAGAKYKGEEIKCEIYGTFPKKSPQKMD